MQEENQEKFYFNINLSIRIFLQSCTNSDYINMIKEEIKSNLNKFQISESLVIDIEKILIDCELFQFSYIKTTKLQMEDTYRNTKYIIEELDKVL
ncbi:MAG: hypothetical protein WCQ83_02080 [Endomicrobiia bacterium]